MRFGLRHHTKKFKIDLTADRLFDDPQDDFTGSKWKAWVIGYLIKNYIPDIKLGSDPEFCIKQLKRLKKLCDKQIQYIETGDL